MLPVHIRRATTEDASALASLRFAFRAAVASPRESEPEFLARCTDWMRDRLGGGTWRCWIAETPRELVGTLWMQTVEKLPNPGDEPEHHAYLTSFFVREASRSAGVGTALLSAPLACCHEQEVDAVFLWSTARSRPLYLRNGFGASEALLARRSAPAADR
jgi:GNAT superfamily N-acetyltransferase